MNGTTEMLESPRMFGRAGTVLRRLRHSIAIVVERALHFVRVHPDAAQVEFGVHAYERAATEAFVDAKQIERAIYNLRLNAGQAPRPEGVCARVDLVIRGSDQEVEIDVTDNGSGVPNSIVTTLFESFVSEGKHKGSAFRLDLTESIAAERGGNVTLARNVPGKTVFRMQIPRAGPHPDSLVGSGEHVEEK